MVSVTSGVLALPIPEDSDPMGLMAETVRDMANQLELTAVPAPLAYTATWGTGGGSPNVGASGLSYSAYYRAGQGMVTCFVWMRFAGAGINPGSSTWQWDLPTPAFFHPSRSAGAPMQWGGRGTIWDNSANDVYEVIPKVKATDNTKMTAVVDSATLGGPMRNVQGGTPIAWADGDEIAMTLTYREAI